MAKPQRNQILGIAILAETFSLPQIMAHLLRGWGLHLAYDATRSVASQKMRPQIFGRCSQVFWQRKICCGAKICFLVRVITTPVGNTLLACSADNQRCIIAVCSNLHTLCIVSISQNSLIAIICKIWKHLFKSSAEMADNKRWHRWAGFQRLKVSPNLFQEPLTPPNSVKSNSELWNNKLNFATTVKVDAIWSIMWRHWKGTLTRDLLGLSKALIH